MITKLAEDLLRVSRKDIQPHWDKAIEAYKDKGFDLSNMSYRMSKYPRHTDGSVAWKFYRDGHPSSGTWTNSGVVYLNPEMARSLEQVSGKKATSEALQKHIPYIIGHELGHEVYRNHASAEVKKQIADIIAKKRYRTDYLDSIKGKNNFDEEQFAEYIGNSINT